MQYTVVGMPRRYTMFILLAFLLNFVWESWHAAYLYQGGFGLVFDSPGGTLKEFVHLMTYASLMDALLLSGVLLGGAVLWKSWDWFVHMSVHQYVYVIVVALLLAGFIEYRAVFLFHQWSYSELMPTLFGLGVSPLLQLPLTGVVALVVARHDREL